MRSSARRVAGVVQPHAVELDDVANEPWRSGARRRRGSSRPRSLTACRAGTAVARAPPDPDRQPDPGADHAVARDPCGGHHRHERLRDDEPGVRGGVRRCRPRRGDRGGPRARASRARHGRPRRLPGSTSGATSRSGRGDRNGSISTRSSSPRRAKPACPSATIPTVPCGGRHEARRDPNVAGRDHVITTSSTRRSARRPLLDMAKGVGERLPEVGGHRLAGGRAVVGGDGLDDPPVLAAPVRLAAVQARKDGPGDEDVRPEPVVEGVEAPVVGGSDDGGVQLRVGRDLLEVGRRGRRPGRLLAAGPDSSRSASSCTRAISGVARPAGRDLRRLRLEHQPDLVELLDVTDRDRRHDGPATRRHRDQALGGHLVHRVADRRDADAQGRRDLRGGDALAGFELATEDPAQQPVVDLLLQRTELQLVLVVGAHVAECSALMHQASACGRLRFVAGPCWRGGIRCERGRAPIGPELVVDSYGSDLVQSSRQKDSDRMLGNHAHRDRSLTGGEPGMATRPISRGATVTSGGVKR